jgi:hypothetical protein
MKMSQIVTNAHSGLNPQDVLLMLSTYFGREVAFPLAKKEKQALPPHSAYQPVATKGLFSH